MKSVIREIDEWVQEALDEGNEADPDELWVDCARAFVDSRGATAAQKNAINAHVGWRLV